MGYLSKPASFAWPTAFDRFFDDFGVRAAQPAPQRWTPRVDVLETDAAYRFAVDVPGVGSEDLEISVENDTLTVSGSRQRAEIEEGQTWRLQERVAGSFKRSFTFPVPVDAEAVTADLEHGILTITVAKAVEAKPRVIKINAK